MATKLSTNPRVIACASESGGKLAMMKYIKGSVFTCMKKPYVSSGFVHTLPIPEKTGQGVSLHHQ